MDHKEFFKTVIADHGGFSGYCRFVVKATNLPVKKYAMIAGIPFRTLQSYILGERKPPEWQQIIIAQYLDIITAEHLRAKRDNLPFKNDAASEDDLSFDDDLLIDENLLFD